MGRICQAAQRRAADVGGASADLRGLLGGIEGRAHETAIRHGGRWGPAGGGACLDWYGCILPEFSCACARVFARPRMRGHACLQAHASRGMSTCALAL